MFRKLVSNLPFSPALVGQIGFYARRLRKEEASRRVGLIMTVFALIVQSLTVFVPSSSANTANASDLIPGGVTSLSAVLAYYDNPSTDYKKIMTYAGITRAEIAAAVKTTINSKEYSTSTGAWLSWGRIPKKSAEQGEVVHVIDSGTTVYSRPLWLYDSTSWTIPNGSTYPAFVGNSAVRGKFAIMLGCGNLATRSLPPPTTKITVCRPGTGIISIYPTETKSGDLPANSVECQPKNVVCNNIVINKIDRTHMSITAYATPEGSATINGYEFIVHRDSLSGAVVASKSIVSSAQKVTSEPFELKETITYYVEVVVKSSLGDKRNPVNCVATFTVAPPEKCEVKPELTKTDPECKPCPGNAQLWYKDPACNPVIVESKIATNLTQGIDATKATAKPGDRIEYKLTVQNAGKVPASASFTEQLGDVLEYATIQDNGGGTYNQTGKVLSWPKVELAAGEKQTRTFVVALPAQIATTARGTSEPSSYDCIMDNTFGNNVQTRVACDVPKIIEQTVEQLPSTGPAENMAFAGTLLVIVTFFWARSRQLGTEVRLVRKDFSAGTI